MAGEIDMFSFKKNNTIEKMDKLVESISSCRFYNELATAKKGTYEKFYNLKYDQKFSIDRIQNLTETAISHKRNGLEKIEALTPARDRIIATQQDLFQRKEAASIRESEIRTAYRNHINGNKNFFNRFLRNLGGEPDQIIDPDKKVNEIPGLINENYLNNNGEYYETQYRQIDNIMQLYRNIENNNTFDKLLNEGELPCEDVPSRIEELTQQDSTSSETPKVKKSWRSVAQTDTGKNQRLIELYKELQRGETYQNDIMQWKNIKIQTDIYIQNSMRPLGINSLPKTVLEQEKNKIENSKYYKNLNYYLQQQQLLENFQLVSRQVNEIDVDIARNKEEFNDIIPDLQKYNLLSQDHIKITAKLFAFSSNNKAEDLCDLNSSLNIIHFWESMQNEMFKALCSGASEVVNYTDNIKTDKNKEGEAGLFSTNYKTVAKHKALFDFSKEWEDQDCVNYSEYIDRLSDTLNESVTQIIDVFCSDEISRNLNLVERDKLSQSANKAKTSFGYAKRFINIAKDTSKNKLDEQDEILSQKYMLLNKHINKIYQTHARDCNGELKRHSKQFNDKSDFRKLTLYSKERLLKIHGENLNVNKGLDFVKAFIESDFRSFAGENLIKSKNVLSTFINNINNNQKSITDFDIELSKGQQAIKNEMNDTLDLLPNKSIKTNFTKKFKLPELDSPTNNPNYDSYLVKVSEYQKGIQRSFSSNKRYFSKNPYMAKIWVDSMRYNVAALTSKVSLASISFKNAFRGTDPVNQSKRTEITASCEKAKLPLKRYDEFFNDIESGFLVYDNIKKTTFFTRKFWNDLKVGLNTMRDLLTLLGIEGTYKDVFNDFTPIKALLNSKTFLGFYRNRIRGLDPALLNFKLDHFIDEHHGSILKMKDSLLKMAEDNINIVNFPPLFSCTEDAQKLVKESLSKMLGSFFTSVSLFKSLFSAIETINKDMFPNKYLALEKYRNKKKLYDLLNTNLKKDLDWLKEHPNP